MSWTNICFRSFSQTKWDTELQVPDFHHRLSGLNVLSRSLILTQQRKNSHDPLKSLQINDKKASPESASSQQRGREPDDLHEFICACLSLFGNVSLLNVRVWLSSSPSSGSPYRDEITLGILQLQESNRLEILKRRWWEGGQCPKEEDHRAKGGCQSADRQERPWIHGVIKSAASRFMHERVNVALRWDRCSDVQMCGNFNLKC